MSTERFDVLVIGGGQAGLATGYHLASRGVRYVILEAHGRAGESWRRRWDSLRVFTSARYDALPRMRFPAPPHAFPTKDEIADYLETYAAAMELPVRTGARVDCLRRATGDDGSSGYAAVAGADAYEAPQVVIATGAYAEPKVPEFATDLRPEIRQLHSSAYRNRSQLQPGGVLVVGASNSGGEIAFDVARGHETWLSGRDTGHLPWGLESRLGRILDRPIWFAINHLVTMRTPMGRKARPFVQQHGAPLERVRPADLAAAGVHRVVGRMVGVQDGLPQLDDGRVLDVRNVIWATGFRHDYPWIDLPVMGTDGWPAHDRGVVNSVPGLYFVGLPFQYSFASALIGGVGRDARHVVDHLVRSAGSSVAIRGAP